jgi:signal transduction histidine kinase
VALGRRIIVIPPLMLDGLIAATLWAVGLSEVAFRFRDGGVGQPLSGPPLAEVAVVTALTLPLAWRRRRPLLALIVVAAALTAQVVLLSPGAPFVVGLVPLLVLTFDAARGRARAAAAALAVTVGSITVATAEVPAMRTAGEVAFSVGIIVGIWLAGRYAGQRQRRADQLSTYAARLESDQDRRAREAIAIERARIARELHDIVAHSVSVMGVQAGAARATLDADPERTRQALQLIEATARDAIGDLGRLLGILRTEDDPSTLAPQPGLGDLDRLLGQVRDAGLPVEFHVEGSPRVLSPGVDLAAYRIVQEALTNVVKHAGPATAEVRIRYNGHAVDVEVTDDGSRRSGDPDAATGCGHGLVGMRERAAVYGGSLDTGAIPGRGFRVHAVLPASPER